MGAPVASLACSGPLMRRIALLVIALLALLPAAAAAQDEPTMVKRLARYMRAAGSYSGAYVAEVTGDKPPRAVFRWRQRTPRILASNTKLFTTSAALSRFGTQGTLGTEVLGTGELDTEGIFRGSLYLRGGGDPTFGSRSFTRKSYGGGATVQDLAALLEETGIERITGRVYGDESAFDSLRGGPDSGYGVSPVGGAAQRALLQPRPLHRERPRLPGEPAGVCGCPPWRGPQGPRRDGAPEAPRRAHASGRARARERRVATDGTADPAHQQAVRQLLRRDAAQGSRGPGRRGRHHGRGSAGSPPPTHVHWARAPRSWTAPGSHEATAPPP